MNSIDIERSAILRAPVQWVLFTIANLDIANAISRTRMSITREDDRRYTGKVFGFRVEMKVLGELEPDIEGELHIVADAKLPFSSLRSQTVVGYRYRALNDESTDLSMEFKWSPSGIIMHIYTFFRRVTIRRFISKILRRLERSSSKLSEENGRLSDVLTDAQIARVEAYRNALDASTSKDVPDNKPPMPDPSKEGESRVWGAELHELTSLYDGFQGKAHALTDELRRITEARDAVATLLTARRMLEVIVSRLCVQLLDRPRGTEPLANVIDKLDRVESLPDNVCTSMRNLNRLSTYGAHPKDFAPRQVREALIALCTIAEWYIAIEEPSGLTDDSEEAQYQGLCRGYYVASIPTQEQRNVMEEERKRLGLSLEEATRIEKEVTPPEIRELQTAIETVYADGMINDNEKLFLETKARELEIDSALAARLIEEYCDTVEESIEAKYQSLCQSFYCDSVPTAQQREEMEQMRKTLGLSKEDAAQIEKEAMPSKLRELQISIETVYADGQANDSERQFLENKAHELGIDNNLSARLIEECCAAMEDSLAAQYLALCRRFYSDSIPSQEQRNEMDQARRRLGLSEEQAVKIEDSCVPDEIEEFRAAIEGVYADGKVRESERQFLDKKAKDLGLSRELAMRIEEEHVNREKR